MLPASWTNRYIFVPLMRRTLMLRRPGEAAAGVNGAAAPFLRVAQAASRAAQAATAAAAPSADAAALNAQAQQRAEQTFRAELPSTVQRRAANEALTAAAATGVDPGLQEQLEAEVVEDADPEDEDERPLVGGDAPAWAGGGLLVDAPGFAPTGAADATALEAARSELREFQQFSYAGVTTAGQPSVGGAPSVVHEQHEQQPQSSQQPSQQLSQQQAAQQQRFQLAQQLSPLPAGLASPPPLPVGVLSPGPAPAVGESGQAAATMPEAQQLPPGAQSASGRAGLLPVPPAVAAAAAAACAAIAAGPAVQRQQAQVAEEAAGPDEGSLGDVVSSLIEFERAIAASQPSEGGP